MVNTLDQWVKDYTRYEKCRKYLIPKEEYFQIIEDIRTTSERKNTKSRHQYYLLSKYEVLQCGDIEKLIKKRQTPDETPVYYVSIEDTYDIVKRAHVATGHGGRDRMTRELQVKYANIQRDTVELFKSLCQECQKKRKRPMTKGVVVKPILTSEFSSHGQVDLIDMQSMSCRTYKWIMVYQDHLTKFCVLRPLKSKCAAEVAFQLADIFLLLGAPVILQSDNGSEFTAQIITELCSMWPELSIVHGKPRHPQSQGSVERANGDIKDMLVAWMADNNSTDWATGIKFVQFSKNSAYHAGIKRSPYAAMFGVNARVGLTSTSLPHEIISSLQSEQDLVTLLQERETDTNNPETESTVHEPVATEINEDEQEIDVNSQRIAASEPEQEQEHEPVSPHHSDLDQLQHSINSQRIAASESQKQQAERMVKKPNRVKIHLTGTQDTRHHWWTYSPNQALDTAITRLRIGHTRLNAHLRRLGMTDSPHCPGALPSLTPQNTCCCTALGTTHTVWPSSTQCLGYDRVI
ncbi:KRAB-A domain-containing protein 2-like [Portunus trituberculatus]|uniref:KRAB-A domain-containing protein 2-like n=1 Tax=Portunus trituberculatus TaxID=210409 RepID=UPI001E1CC21E|nr:KRAB-A domain-containing protein 2-like [Portunus trituberculatus]